MNRLTNSKPDLVPITFPGQQTLISQLHHPHCRSKRHARPKPSRLGEHGYAWPVMLPYATTVCGSLSVSCMHGDVTEVWVGIVGMSGCHRWGLCRNFWCHYSW